MILKNYIDAWAVLNLKERAFILTQIILACSVLIMSLRIYVSHERIVLLPPVVTEKTEVAWDGASPNYYAGIAVFISSSLASVSSRNKEFIFTTLERYFEPDLWLQVEKQMLGYLGSDVYKKRNPVNWFESRKTKWESASHRLFVMGDIYTHYPGMQNPMFKPIVYEFTMKMSDGAPKVVDFTSYDGEKPHDAQWAASNAGGKK